MSANKKLFVLVACGDAFLEATNRCLRSLKHFCSEDIVVVQSHLSKSVDHDQVIEWNSPSETSPQQASRIIKTSLPDMLGSLPERVCYLDVDTIVVSPSFSDIFQYYKAPIVFAPDHEHSTVGFFGEWSLAKGNPWDNDLSRAIEEVLGPKTSPDTPMLNGGVFVFSEESREFFDIWGRFTRQILDDPRWVVRDQATLIATVAHFNLGSLACIPPHYNWLVRHSGGYRSKLDFSEESGFSFHGEEVHLLHYIDGLGIEYGLETEPEWQQALRLIGENELSSQEDAS